MVLQINISRLPALDPEVFNGDPLEHTAWLNFLKFSFQLVTSLTLKASFIFENIFYD